MKYLVTSAAMLSFADGSKFEISKGVHSGSEFPDNVKSHWAFEAYAKQIDDEEAEQLEAANADLKDYVASLESANAALLTQIAEKDKEIADLKAVTENPVTDDEKQETGNAKKQPSTNK
ncbi:STY1053 family phage-associated protein [Klebsiella variicola]|uniref:STY1053 family phage-associated protein n=1 Tax=Klebsiella variicola TaxID=244366 RepID=UPI0034E05647